VELVWRRERLTYHRWRVVATRFRVRSSNIHNLVPFSSRSGFNWPTVDGCSTFFAISESDVRDRILSVLRLQSNFLDGLTIQRDLYGPIWMTVVTALTVFIAYCIKSSIGHSAETPWLVEPGRFVEALLLLGFWISAETVGGWSMIRWSGCDSLRWDELASLLGYSSVLFLPATVHRANVLTMI